MIIRISTERKNKRFLCRLISEHFFGFTVYKAIGFWHGKREKSIVFEIDTLTPDVSGATEIKLKKIAKCICGYNRQDAVLIQKLESNSRILGQNC